VPPLRPQRPPAQSGEHRPGGSHLDAPASRRTRQLRFGTGGPPTTELLIEPDQARDEWQGLDWLVLREQERWIEEGPYHRGQSAVVQAVGRKPGHN